MSVKRHTFEPLTGHLKDTYHISVKTDFVPASDYDAIAALYAKETTRLMGLCDAAYKDAAILRARLAEAERQRDALRKYARHTWDCGAWLTAAVGTPCDCGLDAAIAAAAQGESRD